MKTPLAAAAIMAALGVGLWTQLGQESAAAGLAAEPETPTTEVRRGEVVFAVSARGELQGANSVMLTAPMTGSAELVITELRGAGELVQQNDIVVEFDTTELVFDLREAEADLAEAQQRLAQSKAESLAKEEEARFLLLQAESNLEVAELEARRNDLVAPIVAHQNDLAVEASRDRLHQLQSDLSSRQATSEAAVNKAQVKAETARKAIESMTLRAPRDGYVSIQQNQGGGMFMWGMQLPIFQAGDTARPGMAVAQVIDMGGWELSARLAELDRGHLAEGQLAEIRVAGAPETAFHGRITRIGNTSGPPWDRRFECKLSIENPSDELRPGMSAEIEIQTERVEEALWLPSQALFDRDGQNSSIAGRTAPSRRGTWSSCAPAKAKP